MTMQVSASLINMYFICHRELWLHANGITMEHTSDLVFEGKLVHEYTYPQRSEKFQEIEIGNVKIDFFDAKNKVIHEVKKSDKTEIAHEWQVKFYIYTLEQAGIEGVTGIIEYPKLRKRTEVFLSEVDRTELEHIIKKIEGIIGNEFAPDIKKRQICRNCSYFEFCYVDEE
jgi:CRISPR-associated exonuclease Cas4